MNDPVLDAIVAYMDSGVVCPKCLRVERGKVWGRSIFVTAPHMSPRDDQKVGCDHPCHDIRESLSALLERGPDAD